jgi:uncharacterized membrane protein
MTKFEFYVTKVGSQLWVRPTILSVAAVTWVVISFFSDRFLPAGFRIDIEKSTLVNLFSILASTMLTVATFSVSAMAAAFSSVATSGTPRATGIVMSDTRMQSTLGAFLASFIYAVVSITMLSALDFGAPGRFVLFLGFVLLVGWVLMSFLGWVDRISRLGRLNDTLERVGEKARLAFSDPEIAGTLGAKPARNFSHGENLHPVISQQFGYVQHLDMETLQKIANAEDALILLKVRPGAFVSAGTPIAAIRSDALPDKDVTEKLLGSMTIGKERSFQTDPRFSLILLAEMADRALSPGFNDPGTAIEILTVQIELFFTWAKNETERTTKSTVKYDRIFVPEITAQDLIFDAFTPISRDGAGMIEVGIRLQKALEALENMGCAPLKEAASEYRQTALEMAELALPTDSQRDVLRKMAKPSNST